MECDRMERGRLMSLGSKKLFQRLIKLKFPVFIIGFIYHFYLSLATIQAIVNISQFNNSFFFIYIYTV